MKIFLAALFPIYLLISCGGSENADVVAEIDVAVETEHQDTETAGDFQAEEIEEAEEGGGDTIQDTHEVLIEKYFTFRAIGGVSMGANSVTIAAHYPDMFDTIGSMGGYVNFSYLYHIMSYFFFGGFCPMEQILANLDHINEADNPDVFCGPNKPTMPYEWDWDYNHWHFDDSGGTWDRTFYWYVIEGLFMAFGNMLSYNAVNSYLPAGVPVSWLDGIVEKDNCREALVIGKPYNYNAEYNPEGKYDLITYCDGEEPVGCYQGDPGLCGESNPDYWKLMGAFDPAMDHPYQVHIALAVDYNGNRKRDYGEPVINNSAERFKDTGTDGCPDELEDGKGGCLSDSNHENIGKDPNGDNFDLNGNFTGSEKNFFYDKGEDFSDFGLDGVPESVAGFKDYGEGNGEFDYNPYIKEKQDWEALAFFRNADIEKIERMNFYFDGGIRDAIHALTGVTYFANILKSRGIEVREFDDFTATENSLYPGIKDEQFLEKITEIDFSPASLGRNILVRYGNPEATPQEIKNGDGKHVGTAGQILNRLLFFFTFAMRRWPEPDYSPAASDGAIINSSFYSQAVASRVRYSISLPPGYFDPGKEDSTYPVLYFITGHGMTASDTIAAGGLINIMIAKGLLPKMILVVPEGQCCYIEVTSGSRECACDESSGGFMDCIDPDCTDIHENCDVRKIKKSDLVQECNGGHFFMNFKTDRWGNPDKEKVMKYEELLIDVIDHVDKTYRTKKGKKVLIEKGKY